MQHIKLLSFSLLFNAGCYKKKALSHTQELEQLCWNSMSTYELELAARLPSIGQKPHTEPFPVLWVDDNQLSIDWSYVNDLDELPYILKEKAASQPDSIVDNNIQLAIDSSVNGERVAHIISKVYQAGYSNIWILLYSTNPPPPPIPPNSKHYQKMKEIAYAGSSDIRQVIIAQQIEKDIGLCRPAKQAFEVVAYAPPKQKCMLLTKGIQYAIPRCPGMNAEKLSSGIQYFLEPEGYPVSHKFTLDPNAKVLSLGADQTWEQLVPILIQQDSFWLNSIPVPETEPPPKD